MPTIAIVLCKYVLATALVRIVYLYYLNHCVNSLRKWTITCFNPKLLECGGDMRPQRKIMMVETTHAFVKLKQIKAAVSAGGIKFYFPTVVCNTLGVLNALRRDRESLIDLDHLWHVHHAQNAESSMAFSYGEWPSGGAVICRRGLWAR